MQILDLVIMGRKYRNPLTNPLHYATPQLRTGPPATYAAAQRQLNSYDYGMFLALVNQMITFYTREPITNSTPNLK